MQPCATPSCWPLKYWPTREPLGGPVGGPSGEPLLALEVLAARIREPLGEPLREPLLALEVLAAPRERQG